MNKTKVKEDSNGVYVISGGYIFRPIFPAGYKHLESHQKLKAGETVTAKHFYGSSLGEVKCINTKGQIWYIQGENIKGKEKACLYKRGV